MIIEEEFFKAFGIEKRKKGYCDWDSWCPYEDLTCGDDCPYWQYSEEQYPEITDREYLELLSLQRKQDTKDLKKEILNICIDDATFLRQPYRKNFIKVVKALFEEEQ